MLKTIAKSVFRSYQRFLGALLEGHGRSPSHHECPASDPNLIVLAASIEGFPTSHAFTYAGMRLITTATIRPFWWFALLIAVFRRC